MIKVYDELQGLINIINNKTLDEVKEQYRAWHPVTFDELRFEEVADNGNKEKEGKK